MRQTRTISDVITDHRGAHGASEVGAAVLGVGGDPLVEQEWGEAGHGGRGRECSR